jgi:uncharacterized protein (TIRG00374 family)
MREPDSARNPDVDPPAPRSKLVARLARWGMGIVLVGAALNLALAWNSIGSRASRALDNVAPGWLLVAAALGLAPWFFAAARTWMWARFMGSPVTYLDAFRVSAGTELASSISPKAIGGSPVKVALMIDSGIRAGQAASMLLLDNIADIIFFALVAPAIAFATARYEVPEVREVVGRVIEKLAGATPWVIGIVAVIVVAILIQRRRLARRPRRDGGQLQRRLRAIRKDFFAAYALIGQRGKARAVVALGLTTGLWLCRASVATAVMFGLGQTVDPVLFFLLQWVVFAMMVLVPTPGAALGAEASFAAVLDGFIAEGLLGVVTAAWRFFAFYLPLLFGLAVMPLLGRARVRAKARAQSGPPKKKTF